MPVMRAVMKHLQEEKRHQRRQLRSAPNYSDVSILITTRDVSILITTRDVSILITTHA